MQPRIMRGIHDGAAADGVEIQYFDRRVIVVDRIIRGPSPPVRAGGKVVTEQRAQLPSQSEH